MKSENHQTHRDRTVISIISGFCSMTNTYLRTVVTIARIMYLLLSSILFVGVSSASDGKTEPSDDHLLVEHSVSLESAKNAIQHLAPDLMIGAGCKVCTQREIEYCLSVAVIDDHCCCQRKYHEVFPYIAHTCYVRSRNCEPTVRDCGVFDRLLACCCHHYLGMKWKNQMMTTTTTITTNNSYSGQNGKTKISFILGLIVLHVKNHYFFDFS